MRLDRNIAGNKGRGKYAVVKMRVLTEIEKENGKLPAGIYSALEILQAVGALDYGTVGTEDEFFLMRLKDKNSLPALKSYADSAEEDDFEYASEVREMCSRSGRNSQWCKLPD